MTARVYRVAPESEPLGAADYLRAQADLTQTWIDTHAARNLDPRDVVTSKDIAAATVEVLAELAAYRDALGASERALADAEAIIPGFAWVGSLVLEGVRICLREGRWPDSQECAIALSERAA